jgi:hypothetical protein
MTKIVDYPTLRRDLNAISIDHQGQQLIGLQDPAQMAPETLFLPAPVFYLVSFFDGRHSIVDIQAEYMRRYGDMLFRENIEELIEQLDTHCLLEGGRYQEVLRQAEEEFKKDSLRRMVLADLSYPRDPRALRETLAQYFLAEGGPGPLEDTPSPQGLRGVIAPHIGLNRGGPIYAWAYKAIAEEGPADVYFLLGTAHFGRESYFIATDKDFETPWGTVATDRGFLEALQKRCPQNLRAEEILHRQEHSLEFQGLWLHYLFPDKPITMVPLLCGSFHQAIFEDKSPQEIGEIQDFLGAVKETVAAEGKKVVFIAAADLAHMGQRFGDQVELNQEFLEEQAQEDQAMLELIEAGDAERFFNLISAQRDQRKICGLACIYTLLSLLAPARGKFLAYGLSPEPETSSVVTFASMAYY